MERVVLPRYGPWNLSQRDFQINFIHISTFVYTVQYIRWVDERYWIVSKKYVRKTYCMVGMQWPPACGDLCPLWGPCGGGGRGRLPRGRTPSDSPGKLHRGQSASFLVSKKHPQIFWVFTNIHICRTVHQNKVLPMYMHAYKQHVYHTQGWNRISACVYIYIIYIILSNDVHTWKYKYCST
jgi:hypothetical protein